MTGAWWRLVKFGFRLLYHEMAFTYDTVAEVVSLGQWWDWQRAALPFLPAPNEGKLLELAFGTGHFHQDLGRGGWGVIGLDFSPQMSRLARRRLNKAGAEIRLVRGRAQALPFPDAAFAGVVSTFPTPFILEPATLAEVRRVLQPSRALVMVVSGVLTRGGAAKDVLESAYRVTGQRGGWGINLEQHFTAQGFHLTQHLIPLPRSVVTLLVAQT